MHQYASKFAPNANELTLQHEELTVEGIKQLYLDCADGEDKYKTLVQLYGLLTVGSSIIFVKTRASAVEIEKRMVAEGHTVASLTGGIEGSQRDSIIDKFRAGEAKVLITTNVLARGIDVSTVSMVINYVSLTLLPELLHVGVTDTLHRTSPKFTSKATVNARLISKPTCTVSAVPDVSAVSVSRSRLSQTVTSGKCSTRFRDTSTPISSASTQMTGMRLRILSRRRSRTPALSPTLDGEHACDYRRKLTLFVSGPTEVMLFRATAEERFRPGDK